MNSFTPVITVVIPTYNRSHLLQRAVHSVLAQTFTDYELIIVDDASTDSTKELIESINNNRVRHISHKENKGGSAARNSGICAAKGKYIALLDDDDEWFPEKLEKQINRFNEVSDKVGLVYTGLEVVVEDSDKSPKEELFPTDRGDVRLRLLMGTTLGSPTPMIRRECFEKVGLFDVALKSCQDWDMWKRISEYYEFDYVPEILSRTYLHQDQISSNLSSMIPGRTAMIEKHMYEFKNHPDLLVIHLKKLGKLHCINGTWKEALIWFKQAIAIRRLEFIKILAWCIIELPRIKLFSRSRNFKKYIITKK